MITKEDLLGFIKEALHKEELSVPVYSQHLKAAIFWTGLPTEKAERIQKMLQILMEGSIRHKAIMDDLSKKIKRSEKNAF